MAIFSRIPKEKIFICMVVFTPFGLWKFSSVFPWNSKMRNIKLWLYRILLTVKILGWFPKKFQKWENIYFILFSGYSSLYSVFTLKILGRFPKNFKNEKIFILYYFSSYAGLYSNFSLEIRGWFPKNFKKWKIFIFYLRGCIVFVLFVIWK